MPHPDLPERIAAFLKPDAYPHPVHNIRMLQTHASWVFLSGDFAYKFKKPIDFGFMDFSTLAKRKFFCEQELRLNRRLSPQLYLAVLPVYQQGQSFSLNGPGEVADYCIQMVQFEQADLFDRRLADGALQSVWMDVLAADVAGFHTRAEINADVGFDHIEYLHTHIRDNLAAAKTHRQAIDGQTVTELAGFAEHAIEKRRTLLKRRQSDGFIRHCHGDLHFRNITLWHGKPALFDCIEFNDEYRIIDTINDAAFLVMDCDAHERPDLGFRFLSRYLEFSDDYQGLSLLNLYLFYRAGVRGKVACLLADELPANEQEPQWQQARKYFELAASYTRSHSPALFAIGGLSGSGKSHLTLLGCGTERGVIIRSDATRKRIAGNHPDLELYGREMHINTYMAMFDAARTALNAGFSVILDATFLHPDSRKKTRELAETCDVPLHFFWLDMDEQTLRDNILKRDKSGDDISDADLRVLDLQLAEYQRPDETWIQFLPSNNNWPNIS